MYSTFTNTVELFLFDGICMKYVSTLFSKIKVNVFKKRVNESTVVAKRFRGRLHVFFYKLMKFRNRGLC